ncbi:MAG: SCP2 sterol-binding domain-containing protein [Candidatus Competibacteraceae bacterium]|nr:SCP2 sterol-binding domain-containing protein [Candidatus Competibacteraceae bacterium]
MMKKPSHLCTPYALASLLCLGAAPVAIGCGFHAPMEVRLENMYPGSFPVAVALRRAADSGDQQADDADASLTMDRGILNEIIGGKLKVEQGITNGKIKLDGDPKKFEEFVGLLDTFDPWYQVVMPVGTK